MWSLTEDHAPYVFPPHAFLFRSTQFNKHFHIWAGRFAYLAGVVQCYRGLELVSSDENLVFSAGDGLDLEVCILERR